MDVCVFVCVFLRVCIFALKLHNSAFLEEPAILTTLVKANKNLGNGALEVFFWP